MIDINPTDMTCIYSALIYIAKLCNRTNVPPIVTFDQQLYWKALKILQQVDVDNPVKDTVGTFHMFMNLLGAIGTIFEGSGISRLLENIYGENDVVHILRGKAVQRAYRTHLISDKCLAHELMSQMQESARFGDLLLKLETF
jgi:hypothetical protein